MSCKFSDITVKEERLEREQRHVLEVQTETQILKESRLACKMFRNNKPISKLFTHEC